MSDDTFDFDLSEIPPGFRLAWDPITDLEFITEGTPVTASGLAAVTDPWFSRTQRRDRRGRWVGMGTGPVVDPVTMAEVGTIEAGLLAGNTVRCAPSRIDALMRDLPNQPLTNLEHLDVTGTGNSNLFTKHAREIPRKEMPQIPETAEGMANFKAAIGSHKATLEEVDPRTLTATQNELSSQNVGGLYGSIKGGGWREDSVIFCARNGEILDGHHRWAAASAVVASGEPFKIKVLRVDTDIDTLLGIAESVSGEKVSMAKGLVAAAAKSLGDEPTEPPPDINEPWFWFDGKWLLVVTDTSDGVPPSFPLLEVRPKG